MDAAALLAEYLRRHDDGVRRREFAPLAALFADDGEIVFRGLPVAGVRGPAEVERLFRERGPDDTLVAGPILGGAGGQAHAVYGWSAAPGLVEGVIRVAERGGRIARLEVVARRGGAAAPEDRCAARAVVVVRPAHAPSSEARVLLLRCVEPMTGDTWWITPGGGLDPGEDWESAARRELVEEVGRVPGPLGPCVWTREHVFLWNHNVVRQRERYYLVLSEETFTPAPALAADRLAGEGLAEHRWWTAAELVAEEAAVFSPRRFAALLATLLRDGPPAAPFDAGV